MKQQPIGIFDSGYGGLTVLKEITAKLPQYDYIYLGDNARSPYGTRSFETVYEYTLECVKWLFDQDCSLVILACNTASAKALRSIQQKDLEKIGAGKRVLGVIRPTTEIVGNYSKTNHVGIFATSGTVSSESYVIEIEKFFERVMFNFLFSNADAHLKNFSVQQTPNGDYVFSPAYDLINTFIHIPSDRFFALSGGLFANGNTTKSFKKLGYYTYADFYEFGIKIGIQEKRVQKILDTYRAEHKQVLSLTANSFLSKSIKVLYKEQYLKRLGMLNNSFGKL